MKLNFKNSPTIASDDMAVSKMGVAKDSVDMISGFLRDRIYSNKVLACIRETVTNAVDEHVKYNIDTPVVVKLSSEDGEYTWSVRDFAKGLAEADIRNIYGMYGGSTKRNNNTQVGGFGIGALSPFAFTDTFYVKSHHDGVVTLYACVLGGGDNGIPVGEIYKVSEEPTTETGIEVSLVVTKAWTDFSNTTKRFVEQFKTGINLQYHYNSEVITPDIPTDVVELDGFTFNRYDAMAGTYTNQNSYSHTVYVAIRMGGVIYDMNKPFSNISTNTNGKVIIDVPIGKMTVPISRESIEDTESNRRVYVTIESLLKKLHDEDKKYLTTPKYGSDILKDNSLKSRTHAGKWFMHDVYNLFEDTWRLRGFITRIGSQHPYPMNGGKYIVYVLPDIKNIQNWITRLSTFMTGMFPNTQYAYVRDGSEFQKLITKQSDTLDITDVKFVDIKSLKLPPIPKSGGGGGPQTRFLVYKQGGKASYSASELDDHVTNKYYNGVDIDDEWYKSVTSFDELNNRTIDMVSPYGTGSSFWTANSKKMVEDLYKLGWISRSSPAYAGKFAELQDLETKKRNMQNAEYHIGDVMFRIKPIPLVINAVGKDPLKVNRLKEMRDKLAKEDSPRGRILKSLNVYYPTMTRSDLRKILNLK
jgi:anti-sigma regulatory factor (Ser/Thr protein kinase)